MQFTWLIPSLVFGAFLGFTSGVWHLFAMSVVTAIIWPIINRFKSRTRDPDLEVRIEAGRAFIGEHRLPRAQILWRRSWQDLVNQHLLDESQVRNNQARLEHRRSQGFSCASQFGFWLGASNNSDLELDLSTDGPHLILIGPTGSGKSELLKILVSSLLQQAKSDRLLFLIDFKGGATFNRFAQHANVTEVVTDLTDSALGQALMWLQKELEVRERTLAEASHSDIEQHLANPGLNFSQPMPRLFVIIDELSAVLKTGAQAIATIEAIASRGRSLGVHLICATQSLGAIPRSVLINLRVRIAVGQTEQIELLQLGAANGRAVAAESQFGWRTGALIRVGQSPEMFQFPIGDVK